MSSLTVGLTGGLASGKSTLAVWLRDAGFEVIDADRLVADLYRPGERGSRVVGELFGSEVLTAEGGVDHRSLAQRIFSDEDARRRLEEAIHPMVRERFHEIATSVEGVVVLEAPLLLEAGFATELDLLVAIETDSDTRVARAVERGMSRADARSRLAAQATDAARRSAADVTIENNGSLELFRRRALELIQEIERRAEGDADAHDDA